jgi:hypothetical protein
VLDKKAKDKTRDYLKNLGIDEFWALELLSHLINIGDVNPEHLPSLLTHVKESLE